MQDSRLIDSHGISLKQNNECNPEIEKTDFK